MAFDVRGRVCTSDLEPVKVTMVLPFTVSGILPRAFGRQCCFLVSAATSKLRPRRGSG